MSLRVHVIVDVVVGIVIEGPQNLVDILHSLVCDTGHHIFIVLEGKVVVHLGDQTGKTFPQVDYDVFCSPLLIFHDHLGLGQVNVEVVERLAQLTHLTVQRLLLVVKLDERVCLQATDQVLGEFLKTVHLASHCVFLLKHIVSHLVQGVVEDLVDVLNFLLVIVKLFDESLLLLIVEHLELD